MQSQNTCKTGCVNYGGSNRLIYDKCAYQKELYESTAPIQYYLYEGKHEHCDKCTYKKMFYRPFDLVDVESELKNITRMNSHCPQFKYDPSCPKSKTCFSTFDKSVPIVPPPDACPILKNNIPVQTTVGYNLPDNKNLCARF
jgi:hypothetical protein